MKCEQCDSYLSAFVDDELSAARTTEVQQHLQDCETCQSALEDLRLVDKRLAKLRLPDGGIARLQSATSSETNSELRSTPQVTRDRKWPARVFPWSIVAIIAASLAMAFFLTPQPETPIPIVGHLVRATGSVEVWVPGSDQWQHVEAKDGLMMQVGARVRTLPSVTCEIETVEKSTLRLNEAAELILHAPGRVEVVKGQVWCRASDSKALQIDTSAPNSGSTGSRAPDSGSTEVLTMTCPSDSEFQWSVDQDSSTCHSLSGSKTEWNIAPFQCPSVGPGEQVCVDTDRNISRSQEDSSATKIWQLPLLAIGQSADGELEEILESLLVKIGSTKAGYLHETQIRALGPPGAIPLLAYVESDNSEKQPAIRLSAMRMAAEMADQSAIERLKRLSRDEVTAIAQLADEALRQLE